MIELIGSFGLMMDGIFWWATGIQYVGWNAEAMLLVNEPTGQGYGLMFFAMSIMLLLYTGNSLFRQVNEGGKP